MDCIDLFKKAAMALQTDPRYLELDAARRRFVRAGPYHRQGQQRIQQKEYARSCCGPGTPAFSVLHFPYLL